MAELSLQRGPVQPNSTPGELALNGHVFCWTLERLPTGDHPRIAAGRFRLTRYRSPSKGFDVALLVDVPGRTFIEIHPANWASELLGCIAVGVERSVDAVWNSREAFDRLMQAIGPDVDAGACWLTVKD